MLTFALVASLRDHYISKMTFQIVLSLIRLTKFVLPICLTDFSLFVRRFRQPDRQNSTDLVLLGHFWEIKDHFFFSKPAVSDFAHFSHFRSKFTHAQLLFSPHNLS